MIIDIALASGYENPESFPAGGAKEVMFCVARALEI
jgi:hypothetical protein